MTTAKNKCRPFLALILLGVMGIANSQDNLPVVADEFVYCTVCHGVQVMGNQVILAPRLSDMDPWYIERQLQAFKKGWRGVHKDDLIGMEMQPMAAALSDDQIEEVAGFVATTVSDLPPATIAGDTQKGQTLYQSCAACHGAAAEGNQALGGPALTGINDWYLVAQLQNYLNGARGSNPEDSYGIQMAAATQLLADDEAIHDVVKYISTLATN
jgi:cytochrome c553